MRYRSVVICKDYANRTHRRYLEKLSRPFKNILDHVILCCIEICFMLVLASKINDNKGQCRADITETGVAVSSRVIARRKIIVQWKLD